MKIKIAHAEADKQNPSFTNEPVEEESERVKNEKKRNSLNERIRSLDEIIENLSASLVEANNKEKTLRKSKSVLEIDLNSVEEKLHRERMENLNLRKETNDLSSRLRKLEESKRSLENERDGALLREKFAKDALSEKENHLAQSRRRLEEGMQLFGGKQAEVVNLLKVNARLEKETKQYKSAFEKAHREMATAKSKLTELQEEIKYLNSVNNDSIPKGTPR
jgi:chromosome segregation ATPase